MTLHTDRLSFTRMTATEHQSWETHERLEAKDSEDAAALIEARHRDELADCSAVFTDGEGREVRVEASTFLGLTSVDVDDSAE